MRELVGSAVETPDFPAARPGTPLAIVSERIAGLITAGRRECWGSQTGGAEGHRNDVVPFCFVRRPQSSIAASRTGTAVNANTSTDRNRDA